MTLYQWLSVLGIPSLLVSFLAFLRVQRNQSKALKLGLQAILRDRMLQSYKHFSSQGYADPEDRQNFENLYQQYHTLGANGVMTDIHDKFMALPVYKSN